ncbi:MAG: hypothetical protein VKJ46_02960 [Leptolyngbyaceae bacterium]|nr:hypothetical protein [Leptolyngbyaceae bacterium]
MDTSSNNSDRLQQIEALIQQFIAATAESKRASDERFARMEQNKIESDERLTRMEQMVESNNRFLEAFSQDIRRYIDEMQEQRRRTDTAIAATNQDRQETNARLGTIQRKVDGIARHLGVE